MTDAGAPWGPPPPPSRDGPWSAPPPAPSRPDPGPGPTPWGAPPPSRPVPPPPARPVPPPPTTTFRPSAPPSPAPPATAGWGAPLPPPPGASALRPLAGTAAALSRLLPLLAVTSTLSAVALVRRATLIGERGDASLDDAATADTFVNGIGGVGAALIVGTGVVWIVWQYAHAVNARRLGARGLVPAWAIAGWFVPVGNLVLSQLALLAAARAGGRRAPGVVTPWWMASGVAAVLVAVGTVVRPEADDVDLDLFAFADFVAAAGAALGALAAVLAVFVVRRLTADQATLAASATAPRPGAGWPGGPPAAPPYGAAPPPYGAAPPYQAPPAYPSPVPPTSAVPPAPPPGTRHPASPIGR